MDHRRQLTRLEQKMSADVYMILDVLRQQQQPSPAASVAMAGVRPQMSDVGVNTVPYCDTAGGALLDTVLWRYNNNNYYNSEFI